ncbi:hypothetical protein D3C73_1596320 [compost metagenome]
MPAGQWIGAVGAAVFEGNGFAGFAAVQHYAFAQQGSRQQFACHFAAEGGHVPFVKDEGGVTAGQRTHGFT